MKRTAIASFLLAAAVSFAVVRGAETPAAPAGTPTPAAKPAAADGEVLLFSYFKGQSDGLHLAWSDNGYQWHALKGDKVFLAPQVGKEKLMRDPSISRGPDGVFHLVWTCSWNDHGIGYAESKDLVNWSEQKFIPLMEKDDATRNCWAPELFYDAAGKQYFIIWSSTVPGKYPETDGQDANPAANNPGYNNRMYYVTTKDFKTFSPTAQFFNPGYNCIDGAVFTDGPRYVLVFKDETNVPFPVQKNLKLAFADQPAGPYGQITAPITGNYWAEGPTPAKIGGKWFIYFDQYRDHRFGLITSPDLKTWTDESAKLSVPAGLRHGTVFRAPKDVVEALKKVE